MANDFWSPRPCLLAPIAELFEAADLLDAAAAAHIEGRTDDASKLIRQAGKKEIFDWCEELWGPNKKQRSVHRYRTDPEKPPEVTEEKCAPKHIEPAVKREVIDRDGYICRFCGIPVICQEARSVLHKAYPDVLRWGPELGNAEKHTAFQAMELNVDHIDPRSLGGENTADNLVVACAPCNCGRGNHTLAEVGLMDPRERSQVEHPWACLEKWDGLTRLISGRGRL